MARCSPLIRAAAATASALALLFAAAATTAHAAVLDRPSALASYRAVLEDQRVGAGWSGTTSGCVVGSESPASLAATLRTVNTLRAFAGIGPVLFDDTLNQRALSAALMMRAANRLSHTPDPGWPCYSADGADGAGHSNLFLGQSGAGAMVGYVDDDGVASLGHRRWLLDPGATVFGSGSTGQTNALYVVAGARTVVAPNAAVAWPPAGWVPWQWIFKDWSVAVGAPGQIVSFDNPQVAVTIDGVPAAVSEIVSLGGGFGSGQTLTWNVAVPERTTRADHTVDVAIAGAVVDGLPLPIAYTISAFQPDPPAPEFTRGPLVRRPNGPRSVVRAGQRLGVSATIDGGAVTRYRWLRDGRTIAGQTRSSYRVRQRDRGHLLAVRVTATATGGDKTTVRESRPVRVRRAPRA